VHAWRFQLTRLGSEEVGTGRYRVKFGVYIPFLVNCSKDVITFVIGCECQAACIQCWRESYHHCVHTHKIMDVGGGRSDGVLKGWREGEVLRIREW